MCCIAVFIREELDLVQLPFASGGCRAGRLSVLFYTECICSVAQFVASTEPMSCFGLSLKPCTVS
jgi:hypothetical protein